MQDLDPMFDLSPNPEVKSARRMEYIRYFEDTGDTSNVNNLDEWNFKVKDLDSYHLPAHGYLGVRVQINGDQNLESSTCFPVGATNLIRRAVFSVNGNVIEDSGTNGDLSHIVNLKTLTDYEFDFVSQNGLQFGLLKDTATGTSADASILKKASLNTPAVAATSGKINNFMIPLSTMFGSHEDWPKVWRGVQLEYKFYRQSDNKTAIYSATNNAYSASVLQAYLWFPKVEPSAESQIALNQQLSDNNIVAHWRERRIYRSDLYGPTVDSVNWRITSSSYKPLRLWVWISNATDRLVASHVTNKFHYDTSAFAVSRFRVSINGVQFPQQELTNNNTRDVARQLQYIYEAGGKEWDTRSSSCVNLSDLLDNEFGFYCIPLNFQDDTIFKVGSSTDIFVQLDRTASVPANKSFYVYAILESERETRLRFKESRIETVV